MKYLSIMTTSACTSGCDYCPYPYSWATRNPGYMTDELFEKIIKDVAETYPNFSGHYTFQNGNEPTADPKFIDRIRLVYKYLPNVKLNVPTNAQLLTPEKSKDLVDLMYENGPNQHENRLMRIQVHFSGINKESWQKLMHSKVSYEKTVHNIQQLLLYNQEKGEKIALKEKDHLKYKHEGANGKRVAHFNKHDRCHAIHIGISGFMASQGRPNDFGEIIPEVQYHRPIEWQSHIDTLFADYGAFMSELWNYHNRAGDLKLFDGFVNGTRNNPVRRIDPNNPFKCARFFDKNSLHVLYNGEVTLCCNDWQRRTAIGDMNKQTISEFFESDDYKNLMDMGHGRKESPDNFICKLCTDFQAMNDLD